MTPLVLALALSAAQPVLVRHPLGTLHGFPSMSDERGHLLADGELTQQVTGDEVVAVVRWRFADGRRVEERDVFRAGATLVQEAFRWVEVKSGEEQRRFEVDFSTGHASSAVRGASGHVDRDVEHLDLPPGRSFAGYGTAVAVSQLALGPGGEADLTFVAFTSKPRTVKLEVRRDREPVAVAVEGREVACDRFTLHPALPFPISLFAHPKDAHLWFTHAAPPALVRAEEYLVTKDDPVVIIDVAPRGAARPRAEARAPAPAAR